MKNQSGRKREKQRNVRGRVRKRDGYGKRRSGIWGKSKFPVAVLVILSAVLCGAIGAILWVKMPEKDVSKSEEFEETGNAEHEQVENTEYEKTEGNRETADDLYPGDSGLSMDNNQSVEENDNRNGVLSADNMNQLINQQTDMIAEHREDTQISISIMGDSISTFKGFIPEGYYDFFPDNGAVQDVNETWWKPLVEELGLRQYANASSSGSTCTGDSTSRDNPQYGCDDLRIKDLAGPDGKAPDIIIVYMGTNDLLCSIPLGDNDGLREVPEGDIQNFSDAYTLILDKLRRSYPDAEIYCCTMTRIGTWGTDTLFVEFVNGVGEGLKAADYNECIKQIAGNKGISVIDLYRCGITIDNLQDTTADGVHPTPLGMSYIADTVKESLVSAISK